MGWFSLLWYWYGVIWRNRDPSNKPDYRGEVNGELLVSSYLYLMYLYLDSFFPIFNQKFFYFLFYFYLFLLWSKNQKQSIRSYSKSWLITVQKIEVNISTKGLKSCMKIFFSYKTWNDNKTIANFTPKKVFALGFEQKSCLDNETLIFYP